MLGIYSKDSAEAIFRHLYTKIQCSADANIAKRQTASGYLQTLTARKVFRKRQIGRENYFITEKLYR
ncbi:MAG: hypothetical protein ABW202_10965 [Duganella sp.]